MPHVASPPHNQESTSARAKDLREQGTRIDAALLRPASKSHPPCLHLLRTAASRSGHSGRRKPGLQSHTPISPALHRAELYAHCLPRSSLAASSSAPDDLGGWMTQEPGRSVWEKREKGKDSSRTTCVISMIPVIFLLLLSRRLISSPGGISKVEDLAAEGQTRFPSKNNATSHAGPSQTRTTCRTACQKHERSLSLNKQKIGLCTRKFHARAVQNARSKSSLWAADGSRGCGAAHCMHDVPSCYTACRRRRKSCRPGWPGLAGAVVDRQCTHPHETFDNG
jgi:hypothetical protein